MYRGFWSAVLCELPRPPGQFLNSFLDNRVQHLSHFLICILGDYSLLLLVWFMWNKILKKTWLKIGPICFQPERQRQYCVSFFQLTFVVPASGLHPGSCLLFQTDACCWFWFIYPSSICMIWNCLQGLCWGEAGCVGLYVRRWCQLYSVSKDRCAEDRLCHEHRQSGETQKNFQFAFTH